MPASVPLLHRQHQRVDAEAQVEIEHERAVFDQQIAVARPAVDHARPVVCGRDLAEHGVVRDRHRRRAALEMAFREVDARRPGPPRC